MPGPRRTPAARPVSCRRASKNTYSRYFDEWARELRFLGFLWTFLEGRANYYRFLRTLHYSLQFVLLWLGHFKSIKCLLKVIHKRHPLLVGDHQVPVSVAHCTPRIRLRAASCPANHLRHKILESCS